MSRARPLSATALRAVHSALVLACALVALASGTDTAMLGQLSGAAAALLAVPLLLPAALAAGSLLCAAAALTLLVVGTCVIDGVSGAWDVARLAGFALGGVVVALWWEDRSHPALWRSLASALLAGVAGALSAAAAALLLLPAFAMGSDRTLPWRRRAIRSAIVLSVGGLTIYGLHAVGVLRAAGPDVAAACTASARAGEWTLLLRLFSSTEGLLSGSPLLWLGLAGWLLWQERRWSWVVIACWGVASALVVLMPAACTGFEALIPTLGIGLAHALVALRDLLRRRPLLVPALAGLALVIWNFLLMAQYRGGSVPRDDTVAFPDVFRGAALTLERTVGSPLAWPGNWIADWRHGVPLARFDRLAGLTLFDPADAGQATLSLTDPRTNALLLDGWGAPRPYAGRLARRTAERAGLLLPLNCREPLVVVVVVTGRGVLTLEVNDLRVGAWPLDESFRERRVRVGAPAWRCPLSVMTLAGTASSETWVESVSFVRPAEERP